MLPSEKLPGESGLLERLAIRFRAKTAWPVFWRVKGEMVTHNKHCWQPGFELIFADFNSEVFRRDVKKTSFSGSTFHLRLARKRFIFCLFRDLVGRRVIGVKEATQEWARASVQDNLDLQSTENDKQWLSHAYKLCWNASFIYIKNNVNRLVMSVNCTCYQQQ